MWSRTRPAIPTRTSRSSSALRSPRSMLAASASTSRTRARRGEAGPRPHPLDLDRPAGSRYLITVGIGSPERFPFEDGSFTRRNGELVKRRGGRWPVETLTDWREALVSVAAHEAKHIAAVPEGSRGARSSVITSRQPFSDGTGSSQRRSATTRSHGECAIPAPLGLTVWHDTALGAFGHASLRYELEGETMDRTRGRLVACVAVIGAAIAVAGGSAGNRNGSAPSMPYPGRARSRTARTSRTRRRSRTTAAPSSHSRST